MSEQYKSEALAAVYETVLGLHEAGVLNKVTMKTFDKMCLIPQIRFGQACPSKILPTAPLAARCGPIQKPPQPL